GRVEMTADDVDAVAEFALAHRRREPPKSPPGSRGGPSPSGGSGASGGQGGASNTSSNSKTSAGTSGALARVPGRVSEVPGLPAHLVPAVGTFPSTRRRGQARVASSRGSRRAKPQNTGVVDWFGTLVRTPRPTRSDLRFRARRGAPE